MTNSILTQNEDKDLALDFHVYRYTASGEITVLIDGKAMECDQEFGHYSMSLTAYEAITLASQLLDSVKNGPSK